MVVTRVGPASCAKMGGVLYALLGLSDALAPSGAGGRSREARRSAIAPRAAARVDRR